MSTASEILANIRQLFSSFGINRKRRLDEPTELTTTVTPLGPPKYRRVNNEFPKIIEHPIHFDDENQSAYINSIKRQQKLSTRHRQDPIAYSNNINNTPINKIYDNYQKLNYFSMNNRNTTNNNSNNSNNNNYINLSNEDDDEDNSNKIDNHNIIRSPTNSPLQATTTTTTTTPTNINNENAYLLLNGNNSRTVTKSVPSLPINNNIQRFIGSSYNNNNNINSNTNNNNINIDNINNRRSVPQLIRSKFSRIPDLKHINKIPKPQYNGFDQSGYIASGNRLLSKNNINYQQNNNSSNSSSSTGISMINGGRASTSSGIPVPVPVPPTRSPFARPSLIPVNSRAARMVNLSLSKQSLSIPPRNSILDHNAKCDDKQAYDRLLKSLISGYERKPVKNKEPFALYRSSDWEDDSFVVDGYISEKEEDIIDDGFKTPSQYRLNTNTNTNLYETFDGIRQNESPVIRSYQNDFNEHENENISGNFLNHKKFQMTPLQNDDLFDIHKFDLNHGKSVTLTTASDLNNKSLNLIDFNSFVDEDDDDDIENFQINDNDMIKTMNVSQSILDMSIEKLIKKLDEKKHDAVNQYLKSFETIEVSDDDADNNTEMKSQKRQMKINQTLQGLQKQNNDLYNGISSYDNNTSITIPKVTPVNSLQDRLNNTIKFSNEWLIDFNKRYSGMKIDHKKSLSAEHEKIKKVELETAKLFHEQSIRSSRIPETIIVLEEKEPIEIIDDFPQLTSEQLTELMRAVNGDPDKQLITKFSITICRRDLNTLNWQKQAWLNDEVINFYMNLLMERSQLIPKLPKMYAMNTFFAVRLLKDGHGGVRRWTRKIDIFAHDIIAIPVHVGNIHWCMAIINFQEKSISYYDSMGNPNQAMLNALHRYLEAESLDKKGVPYDMSGWIKESIRDSPRQENGNDCGVFACMTAEFVGRSRPIIFQQKHMRYFRQKMTYEIATGKLLLP